MCAPLTFFFSPMSYIFSIKRPISKADLLRAIDGDEEFSVVSEGDAFIDLVWSDGEEKATFNLVQGEISVTTPSDNALEKMNHLAEKLGAVVIGEEDDLPIPKDIERGVFTNRVTWIGWPIIVILLSILLIWRW